MNPILFFLPAIVTTAFLLLFGNEITTSAQRRRTVELWGLGLLLLFCILWLLSHVTSIAIWLPLQLFIFPYVMTGISGLLLASGLQASLPISRPRVIVSVLLLGAVCYLVMDLASYGLLSVVFAFLTVFTTSLVAFVVAIWLAYSLKGSRKTVALFVGIVFPIGLFFSSQLGNSYSPESQTEQHGEQIVHALDQHYEHTDKYPSNLSELVPGYLSALPEALTTQGTGWLYTSAEDSFILGYWYYPDKMGSEVCLYDSQDRKWNCDFNQWGPFQTVWTPMPCMNDQGEWIYTGECK